MQIVSLLLSIITSILVAQLLKVRQTNTFLRIEVDNIAIPKSILSAAPSTAIAATHSNMSSAFFQAAALRRSVYHLTNKSPIPNAQIKNILTTTLNRAPSAWNSQTTRLILLLDDDHRKMWKIVLDALKKEGKASESTEKKMKGFADAYGTVLFCDQVLHQLQYFLTFYKANKGCSGIVEDQNVLEVYKKEYPVYADKFPQWTDHTSGLHQYIIWTALATEGLGANLQHYNPIIDADVKKEWNVNKDWKLIAQMIFGAPGSPPGDRGVPKVETTIEDRLKVYGG